MSLSWEQVKQIDEKYYLHIGQSNREFHHVPVASTEGRHLIMPDGTKLLDFRSQLICTNMGQRQPKIQEAINEALDRFGYVYEFYCTDYRAEATKIIMEDILGPDGWAGRLRFLNTGSEAVEASIILAKIITNRPNIVKRSFGYHGWTEGARYASGIPGVATGSASDSDPKSIRSAPAESTIGYYTVPAPYCYRCPLGLDYPGCKTADGTLGCVKTTEDIVKTIGPEAVAAVITEVVFGGGAIHPPDEYTPQVREMCKELGILWIDDEVMCGFGRLGEWFGYQKSDGVTPDIMPFAKGVGSSALPASGVVVSDEIAKFFDTNRWWTVSTYAAHPVVMAAVVANLKLMIEENAPQMATETGEYFGRQLRQLQENHKCVGLVNGSGLLWAMEIVKNRETREPFVKEDRYFRMAGDVSRNPNMIIAGKCFEKGVLVGDVFPNTLRLGPSFNITKEEIDYGIAALDEGLKEVDKLSD
jgi:taurine--2-oxoglutarate transaminase